MKFLKFPLIVCFLVTGFISAQNREITLEELWNGSFRTQRVQSLHSMKNGRQYSVLNKNNGNATIDIYDYKTLEKVKTLVDVSHLKEISGFSDYTFSEDESKIILATEVEPIYRRSKLGIYYVFDTKTNAISKISDVKIQEPTFSNDGSKIAFGFENNLYIKDFSSGETKQITTDGKKNSIKNGITDWVYEEEFVFVRAFEWSKNGDRIAYIKFDETKVPEYTMDVYGDNLYPFTETFKYPKAGENNSEVSLHLFNLSTEKTVEVDLSNFNDYYIPRLLWTEDNNLLSVQLINRHQNAIDLVFVDVSNNTSKLVLQEKDEAYVNVTDNLTFLKDNSFIWTSEKDGWNHIYQYNKNGKLLHQITKGPWEVTNYYGYDQKSNTIFYQSVENGSINRDVYSVSLDGKNKTRLTKSTGTNSAAFSADFTYFINTFSSASIPTKYTLNVSKTGDVVKTIVDNDELSQKLSDYKMSDKAFSTIKINGNDLNMWMIKPADFDPSKTYPLFMFQYSGPGSQKVANTWNSSNDYWYQLLAQQGYIIACVDGRGTGFKGADFKKVTQNELGKYEVEDQIAVAKKISELPYIDESRTGIWGWSYGGFMSSNCLFQGADTFEMAIAVAPVTSWRFYDSIYTERYMQTPQENASGYDENSPISHVEKLKGKFLLVHGSADDNVHVQNTMRLIEALVQANKQFDWRIYPDKNHGIRGGNTSLHLYTLMTNFIKENL